MRLFCRCFFMLAHALAGPAAALYEHIAASRRVARTDGEQLRVDSETRKLWLYHYAGCPFCTKTRRAIRRLSLKIETRDVHGDAASRSQLMAGGGIFKVPCLRIADDQGNDTWLYESADIIQYLHKRFNLL